MALRNQIGLTLAGQSGTGTFVGSSSPTLITPNIGAATATSITFPTGNTLSSYFFSTWTPAFSFTTPGNLSVSYATQIGTYTVIGAACTLYCSLIFTPTYTTSTGTGLVTGIPVTPASGPNVRSMAAIGNVTYPSPYNYVLANASVGGTNIQFNAFATGSSTVNFNASHFLSGTSYTIYFNMTLNI